MTVSIYVDGSGGPGSGYGYFVKESGRSFHEGRPGLTNNQAEYTAIISALEAFEGTCDKVTIYSDSKVVISQLNHEFAINNDRLRILARRAWVLAAKYDDLTLRWIPRRENPAGKMLGS